MVDISTSEDDVVADLVFGIVFFVGILISCVPQHVNCWKARSTVGLSLSSLNFSTITMSCRLLATFLEDFHSIVMAHGRLRTWAALMPTLQNAIQVFPGMPTYTIYYFVWYKKSNENELEREDECSIPSSTSRESSMPVPGAKGICGRCDRRCRDVCSTGATLVFVAAAVVSSVLALIHPQQYRQDTQIKVWGGVSAFTNAIMWLPQIITTWRLQSGGVLSIIALVYAAFGDFLLGAYWVLSGERIWVWGSLVADSTMQMILIGMILYFRRRDRREDELSAYREPLLENNGEDVADEAVEMP